MDGPVGELVMVRRSKDFKGGQDTGWGPRAVYAVLYRSQEAVNYKRNINGVEYPVMPSHHPEY